MDVRPYERDDLPGILELCRAEGWPSWPADARRAHRVLTSPGVTALVAAEDGGVAGFIHVLSDGELQAYISLMAVVAGRRGQGIGTRLITEAFARSGAARMDVLSDADGFYERWPHRRRPGFRLYPMAD